jgi:hypothetical protein
LGVLDIKIYEGWFDDKRVGNSVSKHPIGKEIAVT